MTCYDMRSHDMKRCDTSDTVPYDSYDSVHDKDDMISIDVTLFTVSEMMRHPCPVRCKAELMESLCILGWLSASDRYSVGSFECRS